MCKAPKTPAIKEPDKPEFLRNPFLDAAIGQSGAIDQLRTGRSSLRIDLNSGLGIRRPGQALKQPNARTRPNANAPRVAISPSQRTLDGIRSQLPALSAASF